MRSLIRRFPISRLGFVGVFTKDYDNVSTSADDPAEEHRKGIAGVKRVFSLDQNGEFSEELAATSNIAVFSTIGGVMIGAITSGRIAYINFMENNQASLFANHLEAKRMLRDTMMLHMGKGALKWGFRIGGFTTCLAGSNMIISAYTGSSGLLEYSGAGALTGALFKMNLGIRGMIAGSVVGSLIGLACGLCFWLMQKVTGFSVEEIQKAQKDLIVYRNQKIKENLRDMCNDEIEQLKTRKHTGEDTGLSGIPVTEK